KGIRAGDSRRKQNSHLVAVLLSTLLLLGERRAVGREWRRSLQARVVFEYAEVADVHKAIVGEVCPGVVERIAAPRSERGLHYVEVADVHDVVVVGVAAHHEAHFYRVDTVRQGELPGVRQELGALHAPAVAAGGQAAGGYGEEAAGIGVLRWEVVFRRV